MKHTLLIILVGLIALSSGLFIRHSRGIDTTQNTVTAALWETQLPDLEGKNHLLREWQGKILVLNFWATWCPPCLQEIPDFIALQKTYASKNVQFVGIAVDEKQAVADFSAKRNINYPILLATNNGTVLARQWGNIIESVPFTVVIDSQGKIVHRQLGELSKTELQTILQPLLSMK